jgi:hypothetical protein
MNNQCVPPGRAQRHHYSAPARCPAKYYYSGLFDHCCGLLHPIPPLPIYPHPILIRSHLRWTPHNIRPSLNKALSLSLASMPPSLRSTLLTTLALNKSSSAPNVNVPMARESTPPVIQSSRPKRAPRRRPTPLRTSLLAQINSKKGLVSSKADVSLQAQTRRGSTSATAASAKSQSKFEEKQVVAARNRADDADNEVNAESSFIDPFLQAFPHQPQPQQAFSAQPQAAGDSSMLSNNSNVSDSSVIRYENDPCLTPPYKALSRENSALTRRIDKLELGTSLSSFPSTFPHPSSTPITTSLTSPFLCNRERPAPTNPLHRDGPPPPGQSEPRHPISRLLDRTDPLEGTSHNLEQRGSHVPEGREDVEGAGARSRWGGAALEGQDAGARRRGWPLRVKSSAVQRSHTRVDASDGRFDTNTTLCDVLGQQ